MRNSRRKISAITKGELLSYLLCPSDADDLGTCRLNLVKTCRAVSYKIVPYNTDSQSKRIPYYYMIHYINLLEQKIGKHKLYNIYFKNKLYKFKKIFGSKYIWFSDLCALPLTDIGFLEYNSKKNLYDEEVKRILKIIE